MVEEVLMKPPLLLFLKDTKEIKLFGELRKLESDIEAIDVLNDEYEAFDSTGVKITLTVDSYGAPRGEAGSANEELARRMILEYYAPWNLHFRPEMSLRELVGALKTLYGPANADMCGDETR